MWPTLINCKKIGELEFDCELVNCCRDVGKWTYHHEPYREDALNRDFPMLPLDYEGNCKHQVGIVGSGQKFHCCVCGYTITRR